MDKAANNHSQVDGRFAFFTQFLRHPLQIGSIIPSSPYLEKRIMDTAQVSQARCIVELGPGTGGTTAAILRSMPTTAHLVSIELNPQCYAYVSRITDPRLRVHHGSACELDAILERYELPAPDAIISGIPFSTMSRAQGEQVMTMIAKALAPGGRFVAYQVNKRVGELGNRVLGPCQVVTEFRNIPPLRVFTWQAPASN